LIAPDSAWPSAQTDVRVRVTNKEINLTIRLIELSTPNSLVNANEQLAQPLPKDRRGHG
jgi:hypothetical protein